MVILVETHIKILRGLKIKMALLFVTLTVALVMSLVYAERKHRETESMRTECLVWSQEAKMLIKKNEILNILRSKPMTIGQAMEVIDAVASQKAIPVSIALAMVEQESEFYPRAVSNMGARGLTQIMPATIKFYIKDPLLQNQIDRPSINVTGGLMHLSYLRSKFGTWEKSLRAYFAGEDQADNIAFDWYAKGVLRKANKYKHLDETWEGGG